MGLFSSDSNRSASNKVQDSTREGIAEQRRQYDLTRGDTAPYREAGATALGQIATDINKPTTAADVMADPGYQFAAEQGQQAIDRQASASGGRISGASLKAASQFATGQAATGFTAAYQRGQDRLNRLAALARIGQTSTDASAASGTASANAISGLITAGGNNGAAQLAQGNIWGNAANQLSALYSRNRPAISPWVSSGSDPSGYNGTQNNPSAYGGPG